MPSLAFTPQLRRFVDAPEVQGEAASLAALLELAFAQSPRLRAYVLDEQGRLRDNVAAFVDGRRTLDVNQALQDDSRVYLLQALSGG